MILFLTLIGIPFLLVAGNLTQEAYIVFLSAKQNFANTDALDCVNSTGFVCSINEQLSEYNLDIESVFEQSFSSITAGIIRSTTDFVVALPNVGFHVFLFIFLLFFYFVDGDKVHNYIRKHVPLSKTNLRKVEDKVKALISATIYGNILASIAQGFIAGIGYFIFGVTSPIFWGALSILSAFIPFIGVALIWVPIVLNMFATAIATSSNILLFKAIGLTIYSIVLVSSIDNIIKPKIVGDKAHVHPALILLGVFGGLALFGAVGLFIGPLILALFVLAMDMWDQEKHLLE